MFHVKHDHSNGRKDKLISGARELGIEIPPDQADAMLRHLDWLLTTNETLSLTSVPSEHAVRLHLLDSLSAAPEIVAAPAGVALDWGLVVGCRAFRSRSCRGGSSYFWTP